MTTMKKATVLVALGLLATMAGAVAPMADVAEDGGAEAPPATLAAPEAVAPGITFDGEAGTLAGIPESANAAAVAAAARNGTGGLRLSSTAAAAFARWNTTVVPQGHTHASVQLWVRVLSRAAGESVDLVTVGNSQGTAHFDFFVNGTTQRFQWDLFRDDTADTDVAVVYNRWYLVELQVEFAGTEHTAQVRIDGVPQESIASAGNPATVKMMTVGSSAAKTHVQHYDDIELRVADAPLGWLANTPPRATLTRPAANAVYGDDDVVTADFACTATDHTVASCVGTTADNAALDTSTPGTYRYTVTATDVAGYTSTVTNQYRVVDDDPPEVDVVAPVDGAVVARGDELLADFSCRDDGGAMPPTGGCVGSVADGVAIDTSTVGTFPFTVDAVDAAGNHATWSGTYVVAHNRPDVHIRSNTRTRFGGDDVYSNTGAGQTTQAMVGSQSAASFLVRVENDGDATDTFRLRGTRARTGWQVRWYAGNREVSAAIHAGTYEVQDLPSGRSRVLRLVVKPRPGYPAAGRQDVTLTATGGTARDTVRAIVRKR